MQINELNPNTFADMFGTEGESQKSAGLNFGMVETEQDIINTGLQTAGLQEGVQATQSSTTDTTTIALEDSKELDEQNQQDSQKEVDILGDGTKDKTDVQKPEQYKVISDYFQKRVQEGKFVAINDVDDKGNKVPFVPKTEEEFDEVIEMQVNWKLEQAAKDVEKKWYEARTPVWKAVAQYADMVEDPTQLIPFLEGVKTIQSVASFDENEIDGAEQIVRVRLQQTGDPDEVIDSQIESLKTTDKLIQTAKTLKPLIIQQEQQHLARQIQQERAEQQQRFQMINEIKESAYKAIEKPIFGKTKLKQEEKAAIYELIGEPSEETKGYAIYNEIDNLFEKRDFETLKQLGLFLANREAFFNYLGSDISNKTAAGLQRKLQLATDSHSASGKDFDEEKIPSVSRNTYNKGLRFGK